MKKDLVVKHNDLIEGFMEMSAIEYKFTLYLISKIKKNDKDFRKQKISVDEYKKILDYKGKDLYRYMNEFESSLISKHIFIKEEGSEKRMRMNWFSYIKYDKGSIEVAFNKDLEPFLLNIDTNFTKYLLKNITSLKSTYSIRIYELLKQYQNAKFKRPPVRIDELRRLLGTDILDEKGRLETRLYKRYCDFKSKILVKAHKELKNDNNTDIYFEFDEIKRGRSVESVNFMIKKKRQDFGIEKEDKEDFLNNSNEVLELFNLLPCEEQVESSKNNLNKLLANYEFTYIKTDIEYIKKIKPDNFWAYLIKSCEEGHFSKNEVEKAEKAEKEKEARRLAEKKAKELKEKIAVKAKKKAQEKYDNLSEEEKVEYAKEYYRIPEKMRFVEEEEYILGFIQDELEKELWEFYCLEE